MSERDDLSMYLDCLAAPLENESDAALRARVLAQGERLQIRRRRIRSLAMGLAGLALFASGFALRGELEVTVPEPTTAEQRIAEPPSRPAAQVDDPHELEVRAELAHGDEQAGWYRRAGDAWLDRGDTLSATRCYRNHLAQVGRETRGPNPADSWLLLAMRRTLD